MIRRNEQLSTVLASKQSLPKSRLIPRRYFSSTLRSVFYLGMLLLILELFVALSRPNLLGIMIALALLAIFWLNYFDGCYNKFVMVMLLLSSGFDVMWMLLRMNYFCNIGIFSHYSELQRPVHLANAITTLMVNAVLKIVLAAMLIPYRNGPRNAETVTCIKVFSTWEIHLTGEPNPITKLFG